HMDHDAIERLIAMLDDTAETLTDDELAAFYHEIDCEAEYLAAVRRRLQTYIGQRMDGDGALEYRSDLWLIERPAGRMEYAWDVAKLEALRSLISESEWGELVTVETRHKVSKRKADALRKRGTKVAEVLDAAMSAVPGPR